MNDDDGRSVCVGGVTGGLRPPPPNIPTNSTIGGEAPSETPFASYFWLGCA